MNRTRSRTRARLLALLQRSTVFLAYACPLALFILTLLFAFVGEAWWVTGVGMYLPRLVFAGPPLLLAVLLLVLRLRRLLWTQALALLLVVFPLMGLALPLHVSSGGGRRIVVLSFNVGTEAAGEQRVADAILAESPDIALVQETVPWRRLKELLAPHYPHVERAHEFLIASRFPLRSTVDPARISYEGRLRSPRFLRYEVSTPLGEIVFYNVHPLSPRESFQRLRGERGLTREILSGRVFLGRASPAIQANSGLRKLQLEAVGALAARDAGRPIVLAGDMNQVGLSPLLRRNLGQYQDGFREAARGFGYTYPAKLPFMRLDRVLANDFLRFTDFRIGCRGVSDHLCVIAELARERP